MIWELDGVVPTLGTDAWVAPDAQVIGRVIGGDGKARPVAAQHVARARQRGGIVALDVDLDEVDLIVGE